MADVVSETLKQAAENLTENANAKTPATIQGKHQISIFKKSVQDFGFSRYIENIDKTQYLLNYFVFHWRNDISVWIISYYGSAADIFRLKAVSKSSEGNQSK